MITLFHKISIYDAPLHMKSQIIKKKIDENTLAIIIQIPMIIQSRLLFPPSSQQDSFFPRISIFTLA
jgi:hypothetical protein